MIRDSKHVVLASTVLLASWLVSSATSRPQTSAAPGPSSSGARSVARDAAVDSLARDVVQEATRLRDRIGDAPAPRRSGRDPFRFGAAPAPRARRDVRRLVADPDAAAAPADVPQAAPAMPYALIGIAENAGEAGAIERRAILSGGGELFIVGPDQSVGTRFLVVAVGADAVELFDASTNQPVRLVLR